MEVDAICKQDPTVEATARDWSAESLSVSEVITFALFAPFARFASECAFYCYAKQSLRPLSPRLPKRSQFNRLQRQAHAVLVAFAQWWAQAAGEIAAGAFEAVNTLGVVVRNAKRRGYSWLDGQAALGYCTLVRWYYRLRVLTCVTPSGAITGYGVATGSAKEQPMADTFFGACHGPDARSTQVGRLTSAGHYIADTGFEGRERQRGWEQHLGAHVLTPPMCLGRWLAGWRQIVECVHDDLLSVFRLDRESPHALAGFLARLAAKVGLHNFCHRLNRHAHVRLWHSPICSTPSCPTDQPRNTNTNRSFTKRSSAWSSPIAA